MSHATTNVHSPIWNWGDYRELPPCVGFPTGKIKIRCRPDDWVRAYVNDGECIREFIPVVVNASFMGKVLIRGYEVARNYNK